MIAAVGRLAQRVQVVVGEFGDALDQQLRVTVGAASAMRQGVQRRKLLRMRMPTSWLFSTWNCVPARLPAATIATTGPP